MVIRGKRECNIDAMVVDVHIVLGGRRGFLNKSETPLYRTIDIYAIVRLITK